MNAKHFFIGLSVRLIGAAMIWLGDGHKSILSKATVIVGVILSIGGIAVLRFMLFESFKVAHVARRRARLNSAAPVVAPSASQSANSDIAAP